MMATTKKIQADEPGPIEALLPWHAVGTLTAQEQRLVEDALASDPDLVRQFAAIKDEHAATVQLNEALGAPSPRALEKLFLAIDAEPAPRLSSSWFTGLFAALSPRALALSATAAAAIVLLQAGVIGALVLREGTPAPVQTAANQERPAPSAPAAAPSAVAPAPSAQRPSEVAPRAADTAQRQRMAEAPALRAGEPITRSLGAEPAPRALVRFAPDTKVADIISLLDTYQATIVESAKGGLFRLQLGDRPLPRQDLERVMNRLQAEKIIELAVAVQ